MANDMYYIGANDEHGQNPPTPGKRTPVVPGLNRQIYENEFNRAAKNYFIEACMRNSFSVYDVKPEIQDISISQRVTRINRQNLTLLVTFAYNAFGEQFNSASGLTVYYSPSNPKTAQSRNLSQQVYDALLQNTPQRGRGVQQLDVGVLSSVNCVSTLIEAGFMTNLEEAQLMINPLFQTEVGEEACLGVCNYLGVGFIARDDVSNYATIRNGSKNNFVYLLQFILNNQYGYRLSVDGAFGRNTENAVRQFQENNGLSVDGIVGPNTWKTLLVLPTYPTLRQGSRGAYVQFMQALLESNLVPVGGIDGIFGRNTDDAVRQFQQNNGLTVDGIVGPN
ncbi:MAG: peptidoglycan-binding protein, partial [Clostridia bacterium]|nr:peptidoglycan-binding protein [Clostridia bacterium]